MQNKTNLPQTPRHKRHRAHYRKYKFTFAGMLYQMIWSVCKVVIGCLFATYFMCVSGVYTFCIAVCKGIFFRHYGGQNPVASARKAMFIGMLIILSGLAFVLYMARLFFIPQEESYGMILSIAIAACSFYDLIAALCRYRKAVATSDILLSALRTSNIAGGLFSIVLTQVAILSAQGMQDCSVYNAVSGIVFGGLAMLSGAVLVLRANRYQAYAENTLPCDAVHTHYSDGADNTDDTRNAANSDNSHNMSEETNSDK